MSSPPILPNIRLAAMLVVAVLVALPGRGLAQGHGGGSRSNSSSGNEYGQSSGPTTAEPYGGQIYCPVTGKKLPLTAVAVQTTIGEHQPGFWGKMFGQKPTPGVLIYVCCPECVAAVRRDPRLYLSEIVADKSCFNFTYARAPEQRPARGQEEAAPVANAPEPNIRPRLPAPPAPSPLARPSSPAQPGNATNP